MKSYELTYEPALVDLGRAGRATVRASVPFSVGGCLYCAAFDHRVGNRRSQWQAFHALGSKAAGVITVSPDK